MTHIPFSVVYDIKIPAQIGFLPFFDRCIMTLKKTVLYRTGASHLPYRLIFIDHK